MTRATADLARVLAGLVVAFAIAALGVVPDPAAADGFDRVDAFLAALSGGDAGGALVLLDDLAVYEGLLVCPPGACVGRAAIAAALAYEIDDGTQFQAWPETAAETPTTIAAAGEMRCRSLGRVPLAYTLHAEVGPRGIAALRLEPDGRDPRTRAVLEAVAAVQVRLEEARAAGLEGPVTLSASLP